MKNYRREKLTDALLQALEVIVPSEMDDERLEGIKVTTCALNKDMSHVKVFFSTDHTEKAQIKEIQSILNKASGFVRTALSQSISLGYTPTVSFLHDETGQSLRRVDAILDKIAQKRQST